MPICELTSGDNEEAHFVAEKSRVLSPAFPLVIVLSCVTCYWKTSSPLEILKGFIGRGHFQYT